MENVTLHCPNGGRDGSVVEIVPGSGGRSCSAYSHVIRHRYRVDSQIFSIFQVPPSTLCISG
jgi:hypothetical protein